ncbi:polyprenyl synthetase [Streptomyces kunmingensis]|uniref:Polyprenyl synthetase n=1 Tax=Streptomyces kunmingensis TaxID=68225 RepID=A0ABU6CGV3_9ACTN|nr:polyprenyl synthetase [Streptomyces kunmingensis]MEB3963241.1 polyprenyl synthetase [Streptomyces kunmingensis]
MTSGARRDQGLEDQAVLLVAGLADLTVGAIGSAASLVQQLLRRSDGRELARDAQQDLMARGRIALDRIATVPPAHLEVLAQHAMAERAAATGSDA